MALIGIIPKRRSFSFGKRRLKRRIIPAMAPEAPRAGISGEFIRTLERKAWANEPISPAVK